MKFSLQKENLLFYSIVTIIAISVLFSTPFLRYPYDIFHHLIVIDDFCTQLKNPVHKLIGIGNDSLYFMIPTEDIEPITLSQPRYLWHYSWALLFHWLHIDSSQMFLRAKIIHVIQTYISLFSIYYFSKVVIRNLYKKMDTFTLQWLSFWSTFIWLTVYATFSVAYHQVWILWYSVNYQITLPFFWYILGLTIVLFLEKTSWKIKLFFIFQILVLSRLMLQVHSMEFMYYLMYILLLSLVFIDKVYDIFKKYFYLLIPIILALVYLATKYRPAQSPILSYLSLEKLPLLYEKIMLEGTTLLNGLNRASASVNELIYLSLFVGTFYLIYVFYVSFYKKEPLAINIKILIFIFLTSLFILIPLFQFSSGLFAVITYGNVVNRLYYSSSLFLLLPITIYGLLSRYKFHILYLHVMIFILLVSIYIFSKYSDTLHHNYYKNIISIKNSFNERKVGYNLSKEQIQTIGEKIAFYEKTTPSYTKIKYYAPADIAFVIKYLYKKDVDWEGRFGGINYKTNYDLNKHNQSYRHILFEVPQGFPRFVPYR